MGETMARFQVKLFFEADESPLPDQIVQALAHNGILIDHIEITEIPRVAPVYENNSAGRHHPPPEYTGEW
jgi:hypothetical protein